MPVRSNQFLPAVRLWLVGLAAGGAFLASTARAEPEVIGVVACDGYADLRKQIAWFGRQIGNPTPALLFEGMLAGATGGRGLVGLDVKRPFGVVLTAEGEAVSGCGFLPVTDLDKLLDSLKGVVGPSDSDGDDRRIAAPVVGPMRVATKNGWAILSSEILPAAGVDDPSEWIPALSEDFTVAVQLFPSRMPLSLRKQLAKQLEAAAAMSARQGQRVDAETLVAALGSLADVESITIGLRLDETKNRVLLESRLVGLPGSATAKAAADLGDSPLTVTLPKVERPMARGFVAQRIPPSAAEAIVAWIDGSTAGDSGDPVTKALLGSLRAIGKAAVESGRLDGSMAMANTAAPGESPAIEFTGGIHVKDGAALEKSLRELLGPGAGLPPVVTVALDDGEVRGAKLHTVSIDLSKSDAAATLGDTFTATIGISPETCHLLFGGDAKVRLAATLAEPPPAAQASHATAAMQVSLDQWLAEAARSATAKGVAEAKLLTAAAEAASTADSSILQVQARPIERGVAWQVAVDSGVLKAAAAAAGAASGAAGGLPLGIGPPGAAAP